MKLQRLLLLPLLLLSLALPKRSDAQTTDVPIVLPIPGLPTTTPSFPLIVAGASTNFTTFLTNIVTPVYYEDTNNIYVASFFTNAANGHYKRKGVAFANSGGAIFTNFTGVGYLCFNFDGLDGDTDEQNPYYLSFFTNNDHSVWYFSPYNERYGWTTNNNIFGATTAKAPVGTVTYGTNTSYVTNTVIGYSPIYKPFNGGNQLTVDNTFYGANDVAASNGWTPFKTLTAARQFAVAGQSIFVRAGEYNENDLLKNGVNWTFSPAAYLHLNEPVSGNGRAVFDDRFNGPIVSSISGNFFNCESVSPYQAGFFLLTNASSEINFSANKIAHQGWGGAVALNGSTIISTLGVYNCRFSDFKVNDIICSNSTRTVLVTSQSSPNYGLMVASGGGMNAGIYWKQGDMHVKYDRLDMTGVQYQMWPSDGTETNLPESSFWCEGNICNGYIYGDSQSPAIRVWLHIKQVTGGINGLSASKWYIVADKIAGDSSHACVLFNGGGELWLNAQKLVNSNDWLVVEGPNALPYTTTVHAYVQQFEDSATNKVGFSSVAPIRFGSTPTTSTNIQVDLNASRGVTGGGTMLAHYGGFATVNGLTLDNSAGTNATVRLFGAGLSLKGCTLVPASTTNSIYSSTAQTVGLYGSYATKDAKQASVTISPNAGWLTNSAVR